MSSYIIAGSADSIDTAYCEEIARRIKSKYKNIDFRIVIKHPTEWEEYLQQICRIYGFLKKSNPIIYTFDGKIIGNKEAFMAATAKYFGLDQESLNVENLTNQVNMKIATEEINRKNIAKNNIKTFKQKIESQFQNLLKKNVLKHELKDKKQYLTNGIEYIHRSVKGLVPNVSFVKNKEVKVQVQQIAASDIDLMLISQNDQIKVEQVAVPSNVVPTGKQAFVTANEKNNSEHDKMSEASRTNKMHESMVSYDKDSKQMKESSKSKLRIDQENDDLHDFTDYPMDDVVVAELSDNFWVGFARNSHITGEMVFYHNVDSNKNIMRTYNLGRPVNGHRTLIKEIHFDGENALLEGESQIIKNVEGSEEIIEVNEQKVEATEGENLNVANTEQKVQEQKKQQSNTLLKPKAETQKIRTEPNLPQNTAISHANIIQEDDALSQIQSALNEISYLNYHTLFVQKPLSTLEIKNLLYFIEETDSIGCLQFLSQNPNPSVKIYHRRYLLDTQKEDRLSLLLPVQKFISKQLQDEEYTKLQVPNERCYDFESISSDEKFDLVQVNELGFEHYLYQLPSNPNSEGIGKMLKYEIDSMFELEEQLKKHIGYNLVFTREFVMLVPLAEQYEIYNENKLYFDGLAYLGFIHTADVLKPYQLKKKEVKNMGSHLRGLLQFCANGKAES